VRKSVLGIPASLAAAPDDVYLCFHMPVCARPGTTAGLWPRGRILAACKRERFMQIRKGSTAWSRRSMARAVNVPLRMKMSFSFFVRLCGFVPLW